MKVVVVSPSGALDHSALGTLSPDTEVILLTWAGHEQPDVTCVAVVAPSGAFAGVRARMVALLSRNLVGRSLVRLSPFDDGAWFWRTARRDRAAIAAAASADVIVAAERDAIRTAWQLARRNTLAAAVYGYPAARAAIGRVSAA